MQHYREKWLKLTEMDNAIDYLEMTFDHIQKIETRITSWKWILLSVHSALYGFVATATHDTLNDRSLTLKEKKKAKSMSFDESLNRCQNPEYVFSPTQHGALELSERHKKSLKALKKIFREYFSSFTAKPWEEEIHAFPVIVYDALDIIRFLSLETGDLLPLSETQRRKIETIIRRSQNILKRSLIYKESIK